MKYVHFKRVPAYASEQDIAFPSGDEARRRAQVFFEEFVVLYTSRLYYTAQRSQSFFFLTAQRRQPNHANRCLLT